MNSVARFVIRLYQLIVSPFLGRRCRFHPSCSAYAYEAFSKLPFGIALKLTVWRVGKCHPWHPGGVDMVPKCHPERSEGSRSTKKPRFFAFGSE